MDEAVANDATEDKDKSRMPRQTPIYVYYPSYIVININIRCLECKSILSPLNIY